MPDPETLGLEPVRLERRRESPDAWGDAPDPAVWHLPRWVVWAVVLAVVAVPIGVWVDHRVQGQERASIARCHSRLSSASHEYDVRMGAMYMYIRPALGELSGPQVSVMMAQPARRALPAADAALRQCRGVQVLPWHASNVADRGADLAYGSALVARLHDVAGRQPGFQMYDRHLERLRASAGIPAALTS